MSQVMSVIKLRNECFKLKPKEINILLSIHKLSKIVAPRQKQSTDWKK